MNFFRWNKFKKKDEVVSHSPKTLSKRDVSLKNLKVDTNIKNYDTINSKRKLYDSLIIFKFIYNEELPW